MIRSIGELRETPDEDLIREHDHRARNASVGTGYYVDELHRRETLRAMQSSHKLAMVGIWLSVINAIVAGVAVVIAVCA